MKMNRGQVNPVSLIFGIGAGLLALIVLMYAAVALGVALNNNNTTVVVNNFQTMAVNFSAQLGTVGTLLGVGLFLLVIFGGGFIAYRALRGGKGGTGM